MIPGSLAFWDPPARLHRSKAKPRVLGPLPRLVEPPDGGCPVCIYRDNLCSECTGGVLPCEYREVELLGDGRMVEI